MKDDYRQRLIIIVGPTAIGKTKLSIDIAKALDTEIISGDSMLVYRGFDIGSAKPTLEEMQGVVHYNIDIIGGNERYDVTDFISLAQKIITRSNLQGKIPMVVGGTGLYIKALLEGYQFPTTTADSQYRMELMQLAQIHGNDYLYTMLCNLDEKKAQEIHPHNLQRVIRALEIIHLGNESPHPSTKLIQTGELVYDAYVIGLTAPRELIYSRINQRVDLMFEQGLITEVQQLLTNGINPTAQAMRGIGYKEIVAYLNGNIDEAKCVELLQKNTRHFAKRQLTWFKKMPYINWYDITEYSYDDLLKQILADIKSHIIY